MDTCGKIAVIGAGPAGLLTSFFIRRHDVIIFEEHTFLGRPEHCTGIVGSYTASFLTRILGNKIIDNEYYGIVFHTPHRKIELLLDKPIAYHVKRPFLEEKLAEKIQSIGHELILGTRVKPGQKLGSLRVGRRSFQFQKIIASDGAYSFLRRLCFGPIRNKKVLYGRIGDIILSGKGNNLLIYPYKKDDLEMNLKGHHGGLSPDEMLVPIIVF